MRQVRSAAPVAPWMGGKSKLNKKIIEKIDVIPHKTYVEPFVGMGGVFLRRGFQPRLEVANDLNGEIINLFRILQRHYPQLMEVMRFQITSRREFERLRNQNPDYLTDLERAARFLYLQRLAFGGQVRRIRRCADQWAALQLVPDGTYPRCGARAPRGCGVRKSGLGRTDSAL